MTLDDIRIGALELISLLEVIDDQAGDIRFSKPDDWERKNIVQVQSLASIAKTMARKLSNDIDGYGEVQP